MQDTCNDYWKWLLDPIHGYSVSGAYHYLPVPNEPIERGSIIDVWHKHVPEKVSIFVWRMLHNRLLKKRQFNAAASSPACRKCVYKWLHSCRNSITPFLGIWRVWRGLAFDVAMVRHFFGNSTNAWWEFCSVWSNGGLLAIYSFFLQNDMVRLCLGHLERKKQQSVQQFDVSYYCSYWKDKDAIFFWAESTYV